MNDTDKNIHIKSLLRKMRSFFCKCQEKNIKALCGAVIILISALSVLNICLTQQGSGYCTQYLRANLFFSDLPDIISGAACLLR